MEAQQAESRADFIHKMKIASKEGAETQYWLLLCQLSKNHGDPSPLLIHLESINCLLSKIIATTKTNGVEGTPASRA
jgi:four helix bundle protein